MRLPVIPIVIGIGVIAVLLVGEVLFQRARAQTNHVALALSAKSVTVVPAHESSFRASRRYVGSIEPLIGASVGPQFVSAYIRTVEVRPGAVVRAGQVLATLDCREASAQNEATSLRARAIQANQAALARQAERVTGLLNGGFIAANDVDQRQAESSSEQARLEAERAQALSTRLAVSDCVMRAPFDGEVSNRYLDPGAFARPGNPIVGVVDRDTVRVTADVPESDFAFVAPTTPVRVHVLSTNADLTATVTRRSPAADPDTRTVHIELDVPDPERQIPVNTTAQLNVDVGEAVPATEIPLIAADIRGERATVFTVQHGVAHQGTYQVLGESGGSLFVDRSLADGTEVVTEGRATLSNGDHVVAHAPALPPRLPAGPAAPEHAP